MLETSTTPSIVPDEPGAELALCVPTYRRPRLLARLLGDLGRQTVAIDRLIVIDGDPGSGEVRATLADTPCNTRELLYVPSNHANLPYQRFLGWKAAAGARWLLYLDDDMRLLHDESLEQLIRPLRASRGRVVGTTGEFETPLATFDRNETSRGNAPGGGAQKLGLALRSLARRLGSSSRIAPGGLSPAGHRRPLIDRGKAYEVVGCLRGGAMAYRMSALTAACFSDALFAMGERGWGLGEDTLLSRRAGSRGVLLSAIGAGIVHPRDHASVAYRSEAFDRAFATAFSRRLICDHFRAFDPPRFSDRIALAKSYAANVLAAWLRAIGGPGKQARAFAAGYTLGVIRGLLQSPTSRRLTPGIDWWADAERAMAQTRLVVPKTVWVR